MGRLLSVGLGALLGVLISRLLGPAGKGSFAFALLVSSWVTMLLTNVSGAVVYRIAREKANPRDVLRSTLALALYSGTLLSVVMVLLHPWLARSLGFPYVIYIGLAVPFQLVTSYCMGALLGANAIKEYMYAGLFPSIAVVVLGGVALLGLHAGVPGALGAWLLTQLLGTGYAFYVCRSRGWLPTLRELLGVRMGDLSWFVTFGGQIAIINLISYFNYRMDAFLVRLYLDDAALGIYSVAVSTAELLWYFSKSLAVSSSARIGAADLQGAAELTARGARHALGTMLIGGLGLALIGPWLIRFVYGAPFAAASLPLILLIPGVIAYGLGGVLAAFFMNGLGNPWWSALMTSMGLLTNVVFSMLLIPRVGMVGGAIATTISYWVAIAVGLGVFIKKTGVPLHRILIPGRAELRDYLRLARSLLHIGRQEG